MSPRRFSCRRRGTSAMSLAVQTTPGVGTHLVRTVAETVSRLPLCYRADCQPIGTSAALTSMESGASTVTVKSELYYDPYDLEIHEDPYPTFKRLREEMPLYYNARHDFYAVSRHADVARGFIDKENLISSKGDVLELIKANVQMPPGTFIYEGPPLHTAHRGVVAGVFPPKRMASIEPLIRTYAARCLDEFVGAKRFDFIANLGAEMPMRVVGMLVGIPESEQEQIHVFVKDSHRVAEPGGTMEFNDSTFAAAGEIYRHYIEWRADNPSDDLMTDLLNVEFVDEQGITRKLTHGEILM